MEKILYVGLREATLDLLQEHFQTKEVALHPITAAQFPESGKSLSLYQALLIGEQVDHPIRFAQQAYSSDKGISVLLLTDGADLEKIKRALQFSPFIGPTAQCISSAAGTRILPIVEEAMLRTSQRRSFAKLKSTLTVGQQFTPKILEKVREDFTTKVLQEAPIGVVLLSDNATIFSINQYAQSLFEKPEKEVLASPIFNLFPEPIQLEVKQFLMDGFLNNPKRVFESKALSGSQYLELTVAPIDMKATHNYRMLIINNITTSVIAQQQAQAHLAELKVVNANLTRVNADLDTFVYMASHDLKAPILNIEGLVYLLEAELGQDNVVAPVLGHIQEAVNSFKQTVEELTEVSRIQKGFFHQVSLIDITTVWKEVKHILEPEIAATGAEIVWEIHGSTQVLFSKKHFTSILYNLVSNALKYRDPSRKLLVGIKSWFEGEEYFLRVQDNGLGLPATKLHQVFDLFQRLHSHVPGTGVGLYIVKRIVETHGGRITVESKEGKGTVFQMSFKSPSPVAEQ